MIDPLVSANMMTYNHAPFIIEAIEGVLQQKTDFPFELVIGEDCSTDGTREIVIEYQKKYPDIIRVITSDENVGMKINGLRTMSACRGKYIAFCEGDDYWHHPYKLQKQVDYLESHPECGMVFADCDVYHNSSRKLIKNVRLSAGFQSSMKLSIEQILENKKIRRWPWTCTAMFRKNLYEQIAGSDPYLHQSDKFLLGDVQIWAELSSISEVVYIPECLATYRFLDESATHNADPRKVLKFWISLSEMELYLCDKHMLSENIRRKAELLWLDKSLQLALHDRNGKMALEVKKKKTFHWKEWLRYFGAKYLVIHYAYLLAISFRNLFRKKHDPLS
jgi:glycosyltransferase involved in cell wall biosynthesis